ncbi:MAG: hypothetical protein Fur006_50410 [Coleofasciculaceae cyanobacterium]
MPLLNAPVAAYSPISRVKTTDFDLPTANDEVALLSPSSTRKGHLVRNTGATPITVLYGLNFIPDTPEGEEPATEPANFELYRFTLAPGDTYLYDVAEIIPYQAISLEDDGLVQVVELI